MSSRADSFRSVYLKYPRAICHGNSVNTHIPSCPKQGPNDWKQERRRETSGYTTSLTVRGAPIIKLGINILLDFVRPSLAVSPPGFRHRSFYSVRADAVCNDAFCTHRGCVLRNRDILGVAMEIIEGYRRQSDAPIRAHGVAGRSVCGVVGRKSGMKVRPNV